MLLMWQLSQENSWMPRILENIHRGYGIFKGQDSAAGHEILFDVFK